MAEYYTVAAKGVPGNDDYGAMSAQEVVGELSLGLGVQVPLDELASNGRDGKNKERPRRDKPPRDRSTVV